MPHTNSYFAACDKQSPDERLDATDLVLLSALGILAPAPNSDKEKNMALAAAIASGQRDIFAILSRYCLPQDSLSPRIVDAVAMSPNERIVLAVVKSMVAHPEFETHVIPSLLFTVCQLGYLSALKVILDRFHIDRQARLLHSAWGFDLAPGRLHAPLLADDIDSGFLPLHFACKGDSEGNVAVIKYLLEEHRVDIDENQRIRPGSNDTQWTALHVAAYYGCLSAMRYLVEHSPIEPDIDAIDWATGKTPRDGGAATVRRFIPCATRS